MVDTCQQPMASNSQSATAAAHGNGNDDNNNAVGHCREGTLELAEAGWGWMPAEGHGTAAAIFDDGIWGPNLDSERANGHKVGNRGGVSTLGTLLYQSHHFLSPIPQSTLMSTDKGVWSYPQTFMNSLQSNKFKQYLRLVF